MDKLELINNDAHLRVFLRGTCLFCNRMSSPAVTVGYGEPEIHSSHGNYKIRPRLRWKRTLDRVEVEEQSDTRVLLRLSGKGQAATAEIISDERPGLAHLTITPHAGDFNRLWVSLPARASEATFGGGVQFSRFNLRGSRLPIWTGEQGVGRGFNLTTLLANLHSSSGGHWHSTYFPQPTYVTEAGRIVHVESDCYVLLGFPEGRDDLEIWDKKCRILLGDADSLESAVSSLSNYLGRQPRLPEWTHDGMWLGLQGGSDVIRRKVERATEASIPLSGVWAQDWVGKRETAFGRQLFWNWKYDRKTYPDLPTLTAELKQQGIRFLAYINPFLAIEGDLYKEASSRGYCVKDARGSDYMIVVTTFPAALVDLSNPDAWQWFKTVIQQNMLDVGISGWMADYGEYLPTDAVLAHGDPLHYHNRYPAEWARLNHEAISEAGKLDDTAVFMRAGFTGSSRYAHAIWAGDQMVDWSRHDGLPSVIPAALSSGVVGLGVAHSDIGGFTSLFHKKRSKELLLRWVEHAAFTPIMRSHESNRPDVNWQWDGDHQTTERFTASARWYVELAPYRRAVLEEYYRSGLPAMRPLRLHYPDSVHGRPVRTYLFGRDLYVAPVLRPGVTTSVVDLPDDSWIHLWTGRSHSGGRVRVESPLGQPPVFYRADSGHADIFESFHRS